MVDIGGKSKANEWITEDGLLRIKGWARDGLSDKDIATKCLKIGISTFTLWKRKHESIKEALREGRAPEIVEIEDALKRNALGVFVIRETREETWDDGSGNTRKHTVTITKELPPDRLTPNSDLQTVGTKHIAFATEDMAALKAKFVENGVDIAHEVNMQGNSVMFIRDCNGVLIEFIQNN